MNGYIMPVNKYIGLVVATMSLCVTMSLSACDNGSQAPAEPVSEVNETTSDSLRTNENRDAEDAVLFEDYDLISIEEEDEYAPIDTLLASEFIIQNKSDSKTISNLSFEYETVDENDSPVKLLLDNDTANYLIALEPRQRASLTVSSSLDDSEALRSLEDADNVITSYSYDMDGNRYFIDLKTENARAEVIDDVSNVNFDDVNIVECNGNTMKNNNTVPIKVLSAQVAIYDSEGIAKGVEESNPIVLGGRELAPSEQVTATVDPLATSDGDSLKIVAYKYETGSADDNGYNSYEVNLITGQAKASTNKLLLNSSEVVSIDAAREELTSYTSQFGKKIEELTYKVASIEEQGTSFEWLHLEGPPSLFGLKGETVLRRNYDTLLVDGMQFESTITNETMQGILLQTLQGVYGSEYEAHYDGDEIDYFTWTTDQLTVNLFLNSCTITIFPNVGE